MLKNRMSDLETNTRGGTIMNSHCFYQKRIRGKLFVRLLSVTALLGLLVTLNPPALAITGLHVNITDISPDRSSSGMGGSGGRVNGLAGVIDNNQDFYAASEWGGLFKTTDGGHTWLQLNGHLPTATWDVKVDPDDPNRVYATSFYDGRVLSLAGINVSHDGGNTWVHKDVATPPN